MPKVARLIVLLALASSVHAFARDAVEPACLQQMASGCIGKITTSSLEQLTPKALFSGIAKNLALAGETEAVKSLQGRITADWDKDATTDALTVLKVAQTARRNASRAVDLSELEGLSAHVTKPEVMGPYYRVCGAFEILSLELLGQRPYTNGGGLFDVALLEREFLRNHPTLDNATLQAVLLRWPDFIPRVPSEFQRTLWINYARTLIIAGDRSGALGALVKAEAAPVAKTLLDLGPVYVELDDLNKAVDAIHKIDRPNYSFEHLISVAQKYANRGDRANAERILDEVSVALERDPKKTPHLAIYDSLARLRFTTGSIDRAKQEAERAFEVAQLPYFLRSDFLTDTAKLFNDLGLPERAQYALRLSVSDIPPSDKIVAFGAVSGPFRYGDWHLNDIVRSKVAVQLYRSGEKGQSADILRHMEWGPRRDGWEEIFDTIARESDQPDTLEDAALQFAKLSGAESPVRLLTIGAVARMAKHDGKNANILLKRAVRELVHASSDEAGGLADTIARAAAIQGLKDLVKTAIQIGVRATLEDEDLDRRTIILSKYAAIQAELLK